MPLQVYEYLMHAEYFAPRGKKRLLVLGSNIAQRYLSPEDKLIGLVGQAGAGKSLLIRGMFPGLELTNDDDGINIRPLPLMQDAERDNFRCHSYHVDVRFETAFTQLWQLAEAVKKAVLMNRRVVIEHFELLYPFLKMNAEILIGIGEEVIVTRPGIFGPEPKQITDIVFDSIIYRKMSHTAEDLTDMIVSEMGVTRAEAHSDIKHGFVLEFKEKPELNLDLLEAKVQSIIAEDRPIYYCDEQQIKIGEQPWLCTGPRLHVRSTGEVKGFRLFKDLRWDPMQKLYALVGLVGEETARNFCW